MNNEPCLIDIELYTTEFKEYPSELVEFAKEHTMKLPGISTLRGQALALMSQPEVRGWKYIGPNETVRFFENLGRKSRDPIQGFNKAIGLKMMNLKRGQYCLQYPFECDMTDIDKRKGAAISGDRDAYIESIKTWWRKNLVDVPNKEWQVGHLDPTIPDASEKNLAYQPPLQAKYRDRFKWDPYFHKMWPTASELVPNINDYYTDEEQRDIYDALMKKFQK